MKVNLLRRKKLGKSFQKPSLIALSFGEARGRANGIFNDRKIQIRKRRCLRIKELIP